MEYQNEGRILTDDNLEDAVAIITKKVGSNNTLVSKDDIATLAKIYCLKHKGEWWNKSIYYGTKQVRKELAHKNNQPVGAFQESQITSDYHDDNLKNLERGIDEDKNLVEMRDLIHFVTSKLTPRERFIIRAIKRGYNAKEIGRSIGVRNNTIVQQKLKAFHKMKEIFNE